jgi:hypothetical protein
MKAKLIKDHQEYMLINDERFVIATTDASILEATDKMKLSKQNCDEIFGVIDVEEIADRHTFGQRNHEWKAYIAGFNKNAELNKDKLFTLEDVKKAYIQGKHGGKTQAYVEFDDYIQSLQQPTEIEVEIEMKCLDPTCDGINRKGICIPGDKPKLDSEGCIILTKKI